MKLVGSPLDSPLLGDMTYSTASQVALQAKQQLGDPDRDPDAEATLVEAVLCGDLPLVKALHMSASCVSWSSHACTAAAGSGQLIILKWLRQHDFPWDAHTFQQASNDRQAI